MNGEWLRDEEHEPQGAGQRVEVGVQVYRGEGAREV